MSAPSNSIAPPVGSSSLRMMRPTVVLPQPDSPTRPSVSPGAIANETSSTAFTIAVFDDRKPAPAALIAKVLVQAARPRAAASPVALSPRPAPGFGARGRRHERAGRDLVGAPAGGTMAAGDRRAAPGPGSQTVDAERTARRKAAAGGRRAQIRRQALDGLEPLSARQVEPRHRAHQADRVGMARAAGRCRRRVPCSTMRAAYMTLTRSA